MKSQDKFSKWEKIENPDPDLDEVQAYMTPVGFFTRTALYLTTEEGQSVVPVCLDTLYMGCTPETALNAEVMFGGTSLAIPTMVVMIPAMCGHLRHGGSIGIILN